MANEQGFAIFHPADGLWVTGTIEAGGKYRCRLGVEEERAIYPAFMRVTCPTFMAAYCPDEEGYRVVEVVELEALA